MTRTASVGEDVGALGHEMHAAEDDELDAFLLGRLARELEAVAGEIGELDHRILLIVMPEDHQPLAEPLLRVWMRSRSSGSDSCR